MSSEIRPDGIPLRVLLAHWLHVKVNRLAWRFARPSDHACTDECEQEYERWEHRRRQSLKAQGRLYAYKPRRDEFHGPEWGVALRIDRSHPFWRLNDWLASKWVPYWYDHD